MRLTKQEPMSYGYCDDPNCDCILTVPRTPTRRIDHRQRAGLQEEPNLSNVHPVAGGVPIPRETARTILKQ